MVSEQSLPGLCCWQGCLPTPYLGCPLFSGRPKISMFESTMDKIIGKLAGWKAKLLSAGGKLTLAQSVLSSMPIHVLSAIPVPKGVINRIERLIIAF
uniref:Uncharacterized protein n=1 Tax=Kalanchoe fedtschenkoi TaxID=63787 RepID=A0A7N0T1G9_KALFE